MRGSTHSSGPPELCVDPAVAFRYACLPICFWPPATHQHTHTTTPTHAPLSTVYCALIKVTSHPPMHALCVALQCCHLTCLPYVLSLRFRSNTVDFLPLPPPIFRHLHPPLPFHTALHPTTIYMHHSTIITFSFFTSHHSFSSPLPSPISHTTHHLLHLHSHHHHQYYLHHLHHHHSYQHTPPT